MSRATVNTSVNTDNPSLYSELKLNWNIYTISPLSGFIMLDICLTLSVSVEVEYFLHF